MGTRIDLLKAIENSNLKALERILVTSPRLDRPLANGVLPLFSAAVQGDPRIIGALLAAGAKVTQRCKYFQQTALHYARKPEGAQLLVDAGGDINAADDGGSMPLHHAAGDRNTAMVRFLLERGAKPNVHGNLDRQTPLHIASGHGDVKIVELLLDHGADPNRRKEHGITPLMDAAHCKRASALKIIELLLAAGAKVNAKHDDGRTALEFAANDGSVAAVKLLIDGGANFDQNMGFGETVLACAIYFGRADTAAVLLAAGANPDLRITMKHPDSDRRGKTARELALQSRKAAVRELFESKKRNRK